MPGLCRQTALPLAHHGAERTGPNLSPGSLAPCRAGTQGARPHRLQLLWLLWLQWLLRLTWVCCAVWALPVYAMVEANSAPAADLMAIKGIGPATSQKMLEARAQAPFTDWSDLVRRVKGVGAKTAIKMSDSGLRVNGQAWPAASGSAAPPERPRPPVSNATVPAQRPPAPHQLPAAPRWNTQ